jgi:8-oxo-dGTP pyrophosphatase MutT (NUDIX family)
MIVPIRDVDIRFVPGRWPAPQALRDKVPETWARLLAANPRLWDGRVLGVSAFGGAAPDVDGGVLRGEAREDSYSAFLTWRDLGFPEIGIRNVFGSAVVISADGAVLLGRMGDWTANPGQIYPAAGSLEPADVVAGTVRVFDSMVRELHEETGLDAGAARVGRSFAIFEGPRISVARGFHFPQDAAELLSYIRANLEVQSERELADVVAARSRRDVERAGSFPSYVGELMDAFEEGRFGS